MDTAASHDLRRLSGDQRRRALSGPEADTEALAARRARWAEEIEAAFVAAGSVPASPKPQPQPSRLDTRARRDSWRHEVDEVFTNAS